MLFSSTAGMLLKISRLLALLAHGRLNDSKPLSRVLKYSLGATSLVIIRRCDD